MADDSFSTINVAPHPATYIPQPMAKKKEYKPPNKRDLTVQIPNMKDFPALSVSHVVSPIVPLTPMNFLTKLKGNEEKREDEGFYDPDKIATMTTTQLIKEGWYIINNLKNTNQPTLPIIVPTSLSPIATNTCVFPFPPELPRRRMISKKLSYTELYEMDYEDELGAQVPILNDEYIDEYNV